MTVATFIGEALLGWLLADLLGGFVHWLEDRVLTDRTPLVGSIVRDNRLHHAEPMAFTRTSVLSRSAGTALLSLLLALAWYALFGPSVMLVFAAIGGMISNEVHCAAHKRRGSLVRVLQDIGVIQSPQIHSGHHRPPQDKRYCALTAWCNPVLDAVGIWAWLERCLGIEPQIEPPARAGGRGVGAPLTEG